MQIGGLRKVSQQRIHSRSAFGWEPADMGAAVAARAIEPLCRLWCIPGLLRNDWAHAFRLLRAA